MTAIACAGRGGFRTLDAEDQDNVPVTIGAAYDTSDPWAWTMWFQLTDQARVWWTFSRDLMVDALNGYRVNGDGDVSVTRIATPGDETLLFRRSSDSHDGLVVTPAAPILALVRQSLLLVPAGSESVDAALDSWLASVVGAA